MKMLLIIILLSVVLIPLKSLRAQAIDHTPAGAKKDLTNLTDQEKITSETYIHQGLVNRTYKELCEKDSDTRRACNNSKADPKFLGMSSSMVGALSKAYTTIIGLGGLGGSFDLNESALENRAKEKAGKDASAKELTEAKDDLEKSEKQREDYCRYIAVATETISLFQQTSSSKNLTKLPSNEKIRQKDSLLRVSRSHKERAKTANIQTIGWGSTVACYAGYAAMGGVSGDWSLWAKIAGAGLLTMFYKKQVDAHNDYAKKTKDIADKLPGVGDCNPVTQVDCYCAQVETQNDPKYCQQFLHQKAIAATSLRVTCLDSKMKADPQCRCVDTNSCYDKHYISTIDGLGFGESFNQSFKPFGSVTRGELVGGNIAGATNKQFAIAQKALKQVEAKLPNETITLSKEQKKEADALINFGVPAKLAAKLASIPLSKAAKTNASKFKGGSFGGGFPSRSVTRSNPRSKVLTFGGGDGLKAKDNSKSKNGFDINRFLKKKNKKRRGASGKVISFSNKAQKAAQISKRPDTNLFDIISHRYKVSAPRRLGQ